MIEDVQRQPRAHEAAAEDSLMEGWYAMALGLRSMIDRLHLLLRHDFGLTPAQFEALGLMHAWGDVSIRELGAGMLYSSGSTSNLVSQLERRGLVVRAPDEADRRVVRLQLTSEGADVIARALSDHRTRVLAEFVLLLDADSEPVLAFARRVALAEQLAARRPERIAALRAEASSGAEHHGSGIPG